MERTQRKLSTGLTDGLCGYDAYSLALLHHAACGQVAAVALHADAVLALASEHRTNLDALDGRVFNLLGNGLGNLLAGCHDELASGGMYDVVHRHTAEYALVEG